MEVPQREGANGRRELPPHNRLAPATPVKLFWLAESRLPVGKKGSPSQHCFDCLNQVSGGMSLRDRAANSIRLKMRIKIVRQVQGEQNYRDFRLSSRYLIGGVDAVHHRHADVHDDHIGMKLDCLVDRLLAVTGFRTNTPARLHLKKISNP